MKNDIKYIANVITEDPDVINEDLTSDVRKIVDEINLSAMDVATARKQLEDKLKAQMWSRHDIDQAIDIIAKNYPINYDVFKGGWKPFQTFLQNPAAFQPTTSTQPLLAALSNKQLLAHIASTTDIDDAGSAIIKGHWSGSYYPASMSGPEEFPEYSSDELEWTDPQGAASITFEGQAQHKFGITDKELANSFPWDQIRLVATLRVKWDAPSGYSRPRRRNRRRYEDDYDDEIASPKAEFSRSSLGGRSWECVNVVYKIVKAESLYGDSVDLELEQEWVESADIKGSILGKIVGPNGIGYVKESIIGTAKSPIDTIPWET
jgi:hypothetical protein